MRDIIRPRKLPFSLPHLYNPSTVMATRADIIIEYIKYTCVYIFVHQCNNTPSVQRRQNACVAAVFLSRAHAFNELSLSLT